MDPKSDVGVLSVGSDSWRAAPSPWRRLFVSQLLVKNLVQRNKDQSQQRKVSDLVEDQWTGTIHTGPAEGGSEGGGQ